jgi:hypothetical protein
LITKEDLVEETQAPAENAVAVEDNSLDTSPVDETTTSEAPETEGEADTEQVTAPAAEENESDAERKPSRAERRIRELDAKVKQLEQSNQQFQAFGQPPVVDVQPGQELTPEDYQQHVAQAARPVAEQIVQHAMTQERAKNNFSTDSSVLPAQFPELNEESPDYVPELEEAISQEFEEKAFRVVGVNQVTGEPIKELNPSVRLADIAKRYVNVARAAATKSSAEMKNAVAKTADDSAIPPSGEIKENKAFDDLSLEEMEAKLGVVRN